jgi:hypothetical protein
MRTAVSVTISDASAGQRVIADDYDLVQLMQERKINSVQKVHQNWPDVVLGFQEVASWGPNHCLTVLKLRQKVEFGMACDVHARISDSESINRSSKQFKKLNDGSMEFRFHRSKEVKVGSSRSTSSGKVFSKWNKLVKTDPKIASTPEAVDEYWKLTEGDNFLERKVEGYSDHPLLYKVTENDQEEFEPLGKGTISQDCQQIMVAQGVQVKKFSMPAHMLRGASASKAMQLSDDRLWTMVQKNARWTTKGTFDNHYSRQVDIVSELQPSEEMLISPAQALRHGFKLKLPTHVSETEFLSSRNFWINTECRVTHGSGRGKKSLNGKVISVDVENRWWRVLHNDDSDSEDLDFTELMAAVSKFRIWRRTQRQ